MSEQRMKQNDAARDSRFEGEDQPPVEFTIVYGEPIPDDLRALATDVLPQGFRLDVVANQQRDELLRLAGGADFLLVATARVDEELLRAAPRLRLVQHQGVGYDNIDVDACRRAGVPVFITPEGTTIGVAEHTLLLILALGNISLRRMPRAAWRVAGLDAAQPQL